MALLYGQFAALYLQPQSAGIGGALAFAA
jgi:hypothetical protein